MISLIPVSSIDNYEKDLDRFCPIDTHVILGDRNFCSKSLLNEAIMNGNMGIHVVMDSTNTPIAYLGLSPIRYGVGELWLMRGLGFDKNAIAVVKTARALIDSMIKEGMFRIEVAVLPEWRKWAEAIGLEFEHICRKYDGYNDHYVYVRLK